MEAGKSAESKYRLMDEYRDVLTKVATYLDLLLSSSYITVEDTRQKILKISREVKRIQIEIA
jgi:DNA integrity scanning protein DisA with diadenylate cyclase activity